MKETLATLSIAFISCASTHAAILLDEDFSSGSRIFVGTDGALASNFAGNPAAQQVDVDTDLGRFFGTPQSDISGGVLQLLSVDSEFARSRAVGVALSLDGVDAGSLFTVSFGVSNYTNANAVDGDYIHADAFRVSGIDSNDNNFITLDFQGGNEDLPEDTLVANGSATLADLSLGNAITGDGLFSYQFTLAAAGSANDYLLLTLENRSSGQDSVDLTMPTADIDNFLVSYAIPEPSSLGILFAFLGWMLAVFRRRRSLA